MHNASSERSHRLVGFCATAPKHGVKHLVGIEQYETPPDGFVHVYDNTYCRPEVRARWNAVTHFSRPPFQFLKSYAALRIACGLQGFDEKDKRNWTRMLGFSSSACVGGGLQKNIAL